MKASTLVGGHVLAGMVGTISNLVGAPWWAVLAIVFVGLFFTFALGFAQLAMPQESQDKVLLWEKFLAYRERRQTAVPVKEIRSRRAAPGGA